MKKLLFSFYVTVLLSLTFSSCELFDQDEAIPGFIQINSVSITGSLGSNTSCFNNKIENVEVFVNNETIGVYPVGAKIPVFQFGESEFEIFCLVPKSGSSRQLEAHAFLNTISFTESIVEGEVTELDLTTSYQASTVVHFEEYFETTANKFSRDLDDFDTTAIRNVVDDFCDNNSVGEIILYKDYPVMIQSPSDLFNFQLPNFGPAYIEFDYLTEVELVFSFSSITSVDVQFDNVYSVNPKDEWNRIYVNLDDYLLLNDVNTSQLVIGAILPLLDENGDSTLIGKAYIDNLRVISY